MKEPDVQDFGITWEEYVLYKYGGLNSDLAWLSAFLVGFSVAFLVTFVVTESVHAGIAWGIMGSPIVALIASVSVRPAIVRFKRRRLLEGPFASRIKLYEEAHTAYRAMQEEAERARRDAEEAQREAEESERKARRARREVDRAQWEAESARRRKFQEHWLSLRGAEFERELATLYRRLGYRVESTPISGDQGVDLVLRKDGKTTVVQCKGHQDPVGPSIARELLGSMMHFGADSGILACTGGFTRGVEEFVRGKPIELISAQDLATLGGRVEGVAFDRPLCPVTACRSVMMLRTGRHGEFWGCPRFPRCKGWRKLERTGP